jgi:3-dehydroquinate dehydratase I
MILSYHNFDETPDFEYLKDKITQMNKYEPDVYKIALMPNTKSDIEVIYKLQDYLNSNYV